MYKLNLDIKGFHNSQVNLLLKDSLQLLVYFQNSDNFNRTRIGCQESFQTFVQDVLYTRH